MNYFKLKMPLVICLSLLFISYHSFSQKAVKVDEVINITLNDTVRVFDSKAYTETVSILPIKLSYHTNPEVLPVLKSCASSKELTPDNCTLKKLSDLMQKYIVYPKGIKTAVSDVVRLSFIVNLDGSIYYLRDKSQGNAVMINEAIRVMEILKEKESATPFIPGKSGSKDVQVLMVLPIAFHK